MEKVNWYKKSQLGFDKITLNSYKKLLSNLLEEESEVPDYIKNEIPENIASDPEINELLNIHVKIDSNGTKHWYMNGQLHRRYGPALEFTGGTKKWWLNGQLHREDGPASIYNNGTKEWYHKGELHREDGPAIENADGGRSWFINGKRHRLDGPAAIEADGHLWWYIDNENLSEAQFNERTGMK